jgi:hypothetical protein
MHNTTNPVQAFCACTVLLLEEKLLGCIKKPHLIEYVTYIFSSPKACDT